jgi:hypothetical protein
MEATDLRSELAFSETPGQLLCAGADLVPIAGLAAKSFQKVFCNNFSTNAFTLVPVGTFGNVGIGVRQERLPGRTNHKAGFLM